MTHDRLKVMTILGTRPEFIKLSRVIAELDRHFDHQLVHSGQSYDYELNEVFFEQLRIRKPDYHLGVSGRKVAIAIAEVIVKSDEVMEQVKPEAILLYGDTNTCLAVIPAKRRKIPVFHMEAGNRCFDQRVPEELNRKVVDHLSDVNMPLTEHARRYLLAEGLRPETVIKTGSCIPEVLRHYREGIAASEVLEELGVQPGGYFLVSVHREENVDREEHLIGIIDALRLAAEAHDRPVLVSTHPRTRLRLDALTQQGRLGHANRIRFLKPFGFFDYVKLQQQAFCVLSDSGTITEESAVLGFPAVMLREAHERPEGMDAGIVVLSGLRPERVLQSIRVAVDARRDLSGAGSKVGDYSDLDVSSKVVKVIQSYTDYVNQTVWRRGT
jgi:UDP-N-acetylglucosamine 2-epimerase (non-hydrolysing)